jgi:hypothetical protein
MSTMASAPRGRCIVVATTGTATGWGAVAVPVRACLGPPPATADEALVRLCLAALALAAAWGWLQLLAGVADAWRGARPAAARSSLVRRLALAACGAVVVGGLAVGGPAGADTGTPHQLPHELPADALRGLPLPQRAEGPAYRSTAAAPRDGRLVVRAGDSLWRLAERRLPPAASDGAVTAAWHRLYAANRSVVGPDPDVLHPGQVLRPARPTTADPTHEEDR